MRKQRKNKKEIKDAVLKQATNIVVIALFFIVLVLAVRAYLFKSDYFRVRTVEIRESFLDPRVLASMRSKLMTIYRQRNIFSLDLRAISQDLSTAYPDAKDVTASIALPDKLVIGLKLRKPVAFVKGERLYPVDEEGAMLLSTEGIAPGSVPVIIGVPVRYEERKSRMITSNNFKVAVGLLRNIRLIRPIADIGIDSIDMRDPSNVIFILKDGVEIRIGSENFRERLALLAKTMKDSHLAMDRIRYIDLRFNDAVIGPK